MTNLKNIENRISVLKSYLKIVKKYRKYSQKEIETNDDLRGAVERYLYLVCQTAMDLAEAFISFKKLRKPTTPSERFYILNEEKIISNELSDQLVEMTGFRNIVAHDYLKIDYARVCDILQNGLKDIEQFIKIIENKI